MKKSKKILVFILATALCVGVLASCGGKSNTGDTNTNGLATTSASSTISNTSNAPDTSKEVNLVYYLWGSEGTANPSILKAMNTKLKADLNATLEIKYIDWSDVNTKYPLLFASGESFDMAHASPDAAISYFTLASQGVLTDITSMLDSAAPTLKATVPEATWLGTKFNGKIYSVPTLYSEFTPYGYVYRRDLKEKYGLGEINSIASMEAYMDAVVKNETFAPLNGIAYDSQNLYRMFVDVTGGWILAPGIPSEQMHLVATSPEKYNDIIHPAFTQEFEDWAVLMKKWNDKGYWPKDILSAQQGTKENFNTGISGGFLTHMTDWTGNYGSLKESMPGVETDFWCFAENTGKIIRNPGVGNCTVISANSKNPERALMTIEKFMTDESYYRLMQYGIEGKQYQVVDGIAKEPDNYNSDKDGGGFAAWSLRNDKFNIPYASEDPRRYQLNDKWNKVAINTPYLGFSYDSTKVSAELSSIANVNSQIGVQIMLGKAGDPKAAVAKYRSQLKQAGIDKVIDDLKSQLVNFKPFK